MIEVRGSAGEAVPPHNGLNGWNLPWPQWLAGSALAAPGSAPAAPATASAPPATAPAASPL